MICNFDVDFLFLHLSHQYVIFSNHDVYQFHRHVFVYDRQSLLNVKSLVIHVYVYAHLLMHLFQLDVLPAFISLFFDVLY